MYVEFGAIGQNRLTDWRAFPPGLNLALMLPRGSAASKSRGSKLGYAIIEKERRVYGPVTIERSEGGASPVKGCGYL